MQIWMIVAAVIGATVVVFLLGIIQKWFRVSKIANEVRNNVKSIELIKAKYPTIQEYEADIDLELFNQGAGPNLIKGILKQTYETTVDQAYAQGEQPAHFVDRWIYSVMAPQRWDHIESALTYYFLIVQILLENKIRPSDIVAYFGGAAQFQTVVETELANKTPPESVVLKYFPNSSV